MTLTNESIAFIGQVTLLKLEYSVSVRKLYQLTISTPVVL